MKQLIPSSIGSFFNKIFLHRFGPVAVIYLLVAALSFATRLALMVVSWPNLEMNPLQFLGIFIIGLFYDIVVAAFFALPVALYCWLMKDSWYVKKLLRLPLFFLFIIIIFILVLNVGGEIIFWNEFNVRYNFIAVDYLIYTTEVINNIWQSYNMPLILSGVFLVVGAIYFLVRKKIFLSQQVSMRFGRRTLWFLGCLVAAALAYFPIKNNFKNISSNNYVNELGGNGIYEFGHAFWHNEIDFLKFYATRNDTSNFTILKKMLWQPNAIFTNNPLSIERKITADSTEKKWNVFLISIESLSGDYMRRFGNTQNITPYLDSLIQHSLFFENFYATGTRTVRGLEAISLAIPPTPGQSIVRRPNNENMFTVGNLLLQRGYDVRYIYGGNSFFDNMGYFFGNSGYKVIDQLDIPKEKIIHSTAWGVADEVTFGIAMDECDKSFAAGKPFFNHLMTVSNHRPYTYPDGRIDIPSASQSTEGAVKYTDYCINKFINDAKAKPWFKNTVFVILADHCSRSAGKTDLPVTRYHIPCMIYAPGLVAPKMETRLMSQIDLAPTLLGLMNLSYTSKFMGYDIYKSPIENQRIFISTYQNLGYIKNDTMAVLYPQQKTEAFKIDYKTGEGKKIPLSGDLLNEAVAWYQGASFLFNNNGYKLK